MLKKLTIPLLSVALTLAAAQASLAETVMEKVARTGVLTVGADLNAIPYSYINDKEELDGYTVGMLDLVREALSQKLGKPVKVEYVTVGDIKDRITKLLTYEADMVCDTAFTWTRDQFVDFSVAYGVSEVRLLVPKNSSLGSPASLEGKRIGVLPMSVSEKAVKLAQPKATLVPFNTFEEAVLALQSGKVDGVAGDSVLLDGLRQKVGFADSQLVPENPYARYGGACMMRQYDPSFVRLVNFTIVKMMESYLAGDPTTTAMMNRWFGPDGVVRVDPQDIRMFFGYTVTSYEPIPPDGKP